MIRILYIVMNIFSIRHRSPSELLTAQHRPCHPGELLPTASSHQLPAPTRPHFIFQTHHGASFSTGARYPFSLAFHAADTSSPLPGSFAPRKLFKRGPRSTSSCALFTLPYLSHTSSLRSFFLHIPSFSPRAPHGHTQHSLTMPAPPPLPRCPHQPPAAIPPMLSTLLSPFKLVPGFRPLFSGRYRYIYIDICIYAPACILLNTFEEAWWDANMCAERPCTPMLHTINYKGRFEEPWCRVC